MGLKEAIKAWEEKTGERSEEAKVIKLYACQPFLAKVEPGPLQSLAAVEQLSLSTNTIDKLPSFPALPTLRILSVGRNALKSLAGLELLVNLEELWCSYNQIERLNGIEALVNLRVVRAGNNKIANWDGIKALSSLPLLEDLTLAGNPLEEGYASKQNWRDELATRFSTLKKVEGKMVIRDESGKPIRGKEEEAPAAAPGAAGATPEQGAPPADEPKKGESKTPSKGSRVGTAKEGAARKKK